MSTDSRNNKEQQEYEEIRSRMESVENIIVKFLFFFFFLLSLPIFYIFNVEQAHTVSVRTEESSEENLVKRQFILYFYLLLSPFQLQLQFRFRLKATVGVFSYTVCSSESWRDREI